jgi:beta-lactamase class A
MTARLRNTTKKQFTGMAGCIALAGSILMATITQAVSGDAEVRAIERVYETPSASEPLFSGQFLQAVPIGQIVGAVDGLRASYGSAQAVREAGDGYEIETATHRIPVQISLDAEGRIVGLLFKPAERLTASIEDTLKLLSEIPGTISYAVTRDGEPVYGRGSDEKLAVGSAFKLGVLAVLTDSIEAGRHRWDDVLRLEPGDKSLPSGRLQDFPTGSPFTLHTLAAAMIAESDNTATDMLIRLLGREPIAKKLQAETLLTTREFFILKADPDLARRYAEADADQRAAIINEIAGRERPPAVQVIGQHDEGVEWYVSNTTLCELASAVRNLDVFSIEPGPVDAGRWRSVAYKGGSETGVLNLTAAVADEDEHSWCVSVTVNASETIDTAEVTGLFSRLTDQLAADPR